MSPHSVLPLTRVIPLSTLFATRVSSISTSSQYESQGAIVPHTKYLWFANEFFGSPQIRSCYRVTTYHSQIQNLAFRITTLLLDSY